MNFKETMIDIGLPPPKIYQIKNKHFLSYSQNKNEHTDSTPMKNPISTKRSNMLKSTARTHLRNKSGITAPSTTFEMLEKTSHLSKLSNVNASKRVMDKPVKNSNISVSEFTFA